MARHLGLHSASCLHLLNQSRDFLRSLRRSKLIACRFAILHIWTHDSVNSLLRFPKVLLRERTSSYFYNDSSYLNSSPRRFA